MICSVDDNTVDELSQLLGVVFVAVVVVVVMVEVVIIVVVVDIVVVVIEVEVLVVVVVVAVDELVSVPVELVHVSVVKFCTKNAGVVEE